MKRWILTFSALLFSASMLANVVPQEVTAKQNADAAAKADQVKRDKAANTKAEKTARHADAVRFQKRNEAAVKQAREARAKMKSLPIQAHPELFLPQTLYIISPTGTGALCTVAAPCAPPTAWCGGCARPGVTIQLRAGTYDAFAGQFWEIQINSSNPASPVIVEPYPPDYNPLSSTHGYDFIIDCKNVPQNEPGGFGGGACFEFSGGGDVQGYRIAKGLHITNSSTASRQYPTDPTDRNNGVFLTGIGDQMIECWVDNGEDGIETASGSNSYVVAENIVEYNGYDNLSTRGSGHTIYAQSDAPYTDPSKFTLFQGNILHDSWDIQVHQYGEQSPTLPTGLLNWQHWHENISFAATRPSKHRGVGSTSTDFLIGANGSAGTSCGPPPDSGKIAQTPIYDHNGTYHTANNNTTMNLGYDKGTCNAQVTNNYLGIATGVVTEGISVTAMLGTPTITGNTFMGTIAWQNSTQAAFIAAFPSNSYLTQAPGSGVVQLPHADTYTPGRGWIAVWNYNHNLTVAVNPATIGLVTGQNYIVMSGQNFAGPVITSGTYDGGTLTLPTTGLGASQPTGDPTSFNTLTELGPEFNLYVFIPTGGVVPPTPTNTTTPIATNTFTNTPTKTATPTSTRVNTSTSTPTNTATSTNTSTPTNTPTLGAVCVTTTPTP